MRTEKRKQDVVLANLSNRKFHATLRPLNLSASQTEIASSTFIPSQYQSTASSSPPYSEISTNNQRGFIGQSEEIQSV